MEKISNTLFNQLSHESLKYTEWYKQFDYGQQKEIDIGISRKDNRLFEYANPKYNWQQMRQIRLGIEQNIDVSKYNNSDISWEKMLRKRQELRFKKEIKKNKNLITKKRGLK